MEKVKKGIDIASVQYVGSILLEVVCFVVLYCWYEAEINKQTKKSQYNIQGTN